MTVKTAPPVFLKADSLPSPGNRVYKKKKAADFYFKDGAMKSPQAKAVDIMTRKIESPVSSFTPAGPIVTSPSN